jgi:hypothetical protein
MDRDIVRRGIHTVLQRWEQRTRGPGGDDRERRRQHLIAYAKAYALGELDEIQRETLSLKETIPEAIPHHLDQWLDGSESEADVEDFVDEIVTDALRRR